MDNSGAAPFAAGCPLSIDISCPHQVLDQQQGTYIVVDYGALALDPSLQWRIQGVSRVSRHPPICLGAFFEKNIF